MAGDNPIQALNCVDAARKYTQVFLDADVKGYSQWFMGRRNNVADALSQKWQRTNKKFISILRSLFPNQMPDHFEILPIPSKISCWLISLLQQLPVSKWLREEHTTVKLKHGNVGQHTASPLDAQTFSWINSHEMSTFPCSVHLQWLSEKDNSCRIAMRCWLKEQSGVPSHMWCRPSGQRDNRIPQKTMTENLASFYQDSIEHTRTKILNKNNKRPYHLSCSTN
jgi:hypothetical protein